MKREVIIEDIETKKRCKEAKDYISEAKRLEKECKAEAI